jgi:hypothetical protein
MQPAPAPAMTEPAHADRAHGPWNPGIASQIPADLLPLATIFRPEHVRTTLADAQELADLTGLPLPDIVAFRPERLALHEVLVRVTANISVPDGEKIEDLGISFRAITRVLLERHVAPRMDEIASAYERVRHDAAAVIERELARLFAPPEPAQARADTGLLGRLLRRRPAPPPIATAAVTPATIVGDWDARARAGGHPVERAALRALARTVSALLVKHGELWGDRGMIARLAIDLAANDAGGDAIGALVEPVVAAGAVAEGYALLPKQDALVVMNTKGPSAAGKSTMRPLQKRLAGRIGVRWSDFALISPDIWRKQLLDYGSLGAPYKYAGAFTGEELRIVDQKLDRYMARKAQRGEMSHLLIDRFRFDSFAPDSDEAGSNLLTRFGQIVYLFFLVTPPAALVERAWFRGLDVGRYKAVDDTLAHAVEAYSGMPQLFFTWVARAEKRVHFEFLDNTAPRGAPPRTAAFGWNDALTVLDVGILIDIERFRKLDIDARSPEELYADRAIVAPENNTAFLSTCVARFREVSFADQATGRVYLRVERGVPVWSDAQALQRALADPDTRAGLAAAVPAAIAGTLPALAGLQLVADDEHVHTVGDWGAPQGPAGAA